MWAVSSEALNCCAAKVTRKTDKPAASTPQPTLKREGSQTRPVIKRPGQESETNDDEAAADSTSFQCGSSHNAAQNLSCSWYTVSGKGKDVVRFLMHLQSRRGPKSACQRVHWDPPCRPPASVLTRLCEQWPYQSPTYLRQEHREMARP